jgi:P4 family phage/plasmid primase-like protien
MKTDDTDYGDDDPFAIDDAPAPPGGWDLAPDVEWARKYMLDMRGGVVDSKAGRGILRTIISMLHAHGISERTALDLIMRINRPPLTRSDIHVAIQDQYAEAITLPGSMSLVPPPQPKWQPDDSDPFAIDDEDPTWPRPLIYDTDQNNSRLAAFFLNERPGKIIVSDGNFYSLDDRKIWREISEDAVACEFRETDPTLNLDTARIRKIVNGMCVDCYTKARPFDWIDAPENAPHPRDAMLFKNGILDLATGKLLPHTGAYFAVDIPDVIYDPDATCPLWDQYMGQWLDVSFHDTLHEFFGYVMVNDTSLHKLLALIGVRRGGKTTILNILKALIGKAHFMSRTLNDLGNDFGVNGAMTAKLLSLPDVSDTSTNNRSPAMVRIKTIVGEDEISINRKHRDIITAKVPARIVLTANRHPKFIDESGALAGRELVITFTKTFEGKENRNLEAELLAELSGIANRAIEGLRRLRSNGGKFTVGAAGRAAQREIAESQSPALRFANERLVLTGDRDDIAKIDDVFLAYQQWADDESLSGNERRNREDFKNDLVAALSARGIKYGKPRWHDPRKSKVGKGVQVRAFTGCKLK